MSLFDPALLATHATIVAPSASECVRRLRVLDKLRRRRDDGSLGALVETRVEQSFNEQLFAEVFDYRTLFRDGAGSYHLKPKGYSSLTRQYNDFSLGFFGPGDAGEERVSAELKGLSIDLDAPQTNREDRASPVAQAHGQVAGEATSWVVVSDFDEMRLYRAGAQTDFERVILTELDTVEDFRRAYALFGRASLLGATADTPSPLERLWEEKDTAMLKPQTGHARLIHEAAVTEGKLDELRQSPARLYALDDALREVFGELDSARSTGIPWWPARPPAYSMKLEGGKLRQSQEVDGRTTLVEASPAGSLRVWEHVGTPHQSGSVVLQAEELARAMAAFVHFAGRSLHQGCTTSTIRFRWSLRDVDGAILGYPGDWSSGMSPLRCGVEAAASPWVSVDFTKKAGEQTMGDLLGAFRELLFPFEREAAGGTVVRLVPPQESFAKRVGASVAAALRLGS